MYVSMIDMSWNSMLIKSENSSNVIVLHIVSHFFNYCLFWPLHIHSINHILMMNAFKFMNTEVLCRFGKLFSSNRVSIWQTKKVNEVLIWKWVKCGSKEHSLIIGMCKDEKDMMLLVHFYSLLVDIDDYKSDKVKC